MEVKIPGVMMLGLLASPMAGAEAMSAYDLCLLDALKTKDGSTKIEDVRNQCQLQQVVDVQPEPEAEAPLQEEEQESVVTKRVESERKTAFEPFVMTAHRMNYILPVTYSDRINKDAYAETDWADDLRHAEAEFQISFKVPLNYEDLLFDGDGLFFGMTLKSFWQVYAQDISRPFRETNYRPELFYFTPTAWSPMGGKTWLGFGIEHESNGQRQDLSRSWNRIYTNLTFSKDNFAIALQPWWRIPEDSKDSPDDPDGDDNPDIEDYMGHFELTSAYKWDEYEFTFLGRENFATHKGFAQLGVTFPIWGKVRGYAQYSTGYGASLIDYDQNQQRVGVGVAITGLL
ncbi:phospholipase A [Vibrio sp. V39_P1S14PM300]|uniref:phospholipase A n=1 Tax=Vibrio sp. V39_P1S14PM300 TaxID=1938690 RepID=UPI001373386A|nr:phospholipase A [Vibrio sp. V39_P1S14PM300]NAX22855.1 phospholipase [Vibrio sp. V39_P1S14PM300]